MYDILCYMFRLLVFKSQELQYAARNEQYEKSNITVYTIFWAKAWHVYRPKETKHAHTDEN